MKKLLPIAGILPLLAFAAAAQDDVRLKLKADAESMQVAAQMKMQAIGAVKGMTVKGAPYSAEEINETDQMLADGTRIHRETHAMVYRDSEGRTRRETPDNITITDPVANVTYILNPKTMTGQKLNVATGTYSYVRTEKAGAVGGASAGGGQGFGFATAGGPGSANVAYTMRMESDGGTPTITINGKTLDPKTVEELMAKAKANGDHAVAVDGATLNLQVFDKFVPGQAMGVSGGMMLRPAGEALPSQTIEGVNAEGRRSVTTIEAGAIGNDRPIQVTNETWYSPDLHTTVMTKHSDPRTGEESFRLTGISRGDPAAYLFQLPTGYTVNERK